MAYCTLNTHRLSVTSLCYMISQSCDFLVPIKSNTFMMLHLSFVNNACPFNLLCKIWSIHNIKLVRKHSVFVSTDYNYCC